MTTTTTRYHVYAEDGFESAHRSQRAAETVAKRGSRLRRVEYQVVACDPHGFTGGGSTAPILATYRHGAKVAA